MEKRVEKEGARVSCCFVLSLRNEGRWMVRSTVQMFQ
jgi:hypothetical protein